MIDHERRPRASRGRDQVAGLLDRLGPADLRGPGRPAAAAGRVDVEARAGKLDGDRTTGAARRARDERHSHRLGHLGTSPRRHLPDCSSQAPITASSTASAFPFSRSATTIMCFAKRSAPRRSRGTTGAGGLETRTTHERRCGCRRAAAPPGGRDTANRASPHDDSRKHRRAAARRLIRKPHRRSRAASGCVADRAWRGGGSGCGVGRRRLRIRAGIRWERRLRRCRRERRLWRSRREGWLVASSSPAVSPRCGFGNARGARDGRHRRFGRSGRARGSPRRRRPPRARRDARGSAAGSTGGASGLERTLAGAAVHRDEHARAALEVARSNLCAQPGEAVRRVAVPRVPAVPPVGVRRREPERRAGPALPTISGTRVRARQQHGVLDPVVRALERHALAGEQPADDRERLLEARRPCGRTGCRTRGTPSRSSPRRGRGRSGRRETSSIAAAMRAIRPGGWNAVDATSGPSRTRSVDAASAASVVHTSHGPRSGRPSPR